MTTHSHYPDLLNRLFVYGTLTDPSTFKSVTGTAYVIIENRIPPDHEPYAISARLIDHQADYLDGHYLYAVRHPGVSIPGRLVCRIDAEILGRLDAYEGNGYRREIVTVQTVRGDARAYAYLSASVPDLQTRA